MRWIALTLAFAAGLATGETDGASTPVRAGGPAVGVVVDQTRGADPRAVAEARREVARLRASGTPAELRVTHSPAQTAAAASTLVVRGADRLVTYGETHAAVAGALDGRVAVTARR
jgi:hypothetical protein